MKRSITSNTTRTTKLPPVSNQSYDGLLTDMLPLTFSHFGQPTSVFLKSQGCLKEENGRAKDHGIREISGSEFRRTYKS